jgi:hypothetical protein
MDKKNIDQVVQNVNESGELRRETINALLEIAPEVLEQIHGGIGNACDCCKWDPAIA